MTVEILLECVSHAVDVVLPQLVAGVLRAVCLSVLVEAANRWCGPGFVFVKI